MINIGNVFSHITLKKGVGEFPDVIFLSFFIFFLFFYTVLKFDILNAGVSFRSETEAKLNKA